MLLTRLFFVVLVVFLCVFVGWRGVGIQCIISYPLVAMILRVDPSLLLKPLPAVSKGLKQPDTADILNHRNIGAVIVRIGFWVCYTVCKKRNHQNSIGI